MLITLSLTRSTVYFMLQELLQKVNSISMATLLTLSLILPCAMMPIPVYHEADDISHSMFYKLGQVTPHRHSDSSSQHPRTRQIQTTAEETTREGGPPHKARTLGGNKHHPQLSSHPFVSEDFTDLLDKFTSENKLANLAFQQTDNHRQSSLSLPLLSKDKSSLSKMPLIPSDSTMDTKINFSREKRFADKGLIAAKLLKKKSKRSKQKKTNKKSFQTLVGRKIKKSSKFQQLIQRLNRNQLMKLLQELKLQNEHKKIMLINRWGR